MKALTTLSLILVGLYHNLANAAEELLWSGVHSKLPGDVTNVGRGDLAICAGAGNGSFRDSISPDEHYSTLTFQVPRHWLCLHTMCQIAATSRFCCTCKQTSVAALPAKRWPHICLQGSEFNKKIRFARQDWPGFCCLQWPPSRQDTQYDTHPNP